MPRLIPTPETATIPEVGMVLLLLLEQHIRTLDLLEQGHHQEGAVVTIHQDQVA